MNTTLLTKQAWRLLKEPDSYLASTLKGIYFNNSDFWYATPKGRSSWVWKSLLQGRELLKSFGRWSIGAGVNIDIRKDNWVASGKPLVLKPNATVTIVQQLINSNHEWDLQMIRNNVDHSSAFDILKTPISWSSTVDNLFWPYSKNGRYEVKSGYQLLIRNSQNPTTALSTSNFTPTELWSGIWGAHVPEKVKHFTWRPYHNVLSKREALHRKDSM